LPLLNVCAEGAQRAVRSTRVPSPIVDGETLAIEPYFPGLMATSGGAGGALAKALEV
jgi:hypothetical protein